MSTKIVWALEIEIAECAGREQLCALLWNENIAGIEEQQKHIVIFATCKTIFENCTLLYAQYPYRIYCLPHTDWNLSWEQNYSDVYIDNHLHIRAPHHQKDMNINMEITIQPKMSFGTGHHASTYLMLKHMLKGNFQHKSVLDIGTGTGILAIVAAKLGAQSTVAIDNDDICVSNAIENIALNNTHHIRVLHDTKFKPYTDTYDIVLANIHLDFLLKNIDKLSHLLLKGGLLFVSGFLEQDMVHIKHVYQPIFKCIKQAIHTEKESWAFILFEKIV